MVTPAATRTIRVILADDHPLVLNGLYHLLQEYPEFEVLERCSSGHEARRVYPPPASRHPGARPAHARDERAGRRAQLHPDGIPPRIVLLTAALHEDELIEALHLGVAGFVLKEMATKLLVECLRRVHAGGQWLEKDAAGRAMAKLVRREAKGREIATLLTPREIEVVRMVAKGHANKEISSELFIAEGTVKIHLHNIYEKLKINRRADLVRIADEYGLK